MIARRISAIIGSIATVLLMASFTDGSVVNQTGWQRDKLKGKVKEFRVYNVQYSYSSNQQYKRISEIKKYDEKGNLTEDNFVLNKRTTYKYDSKGNLTKAYDYLFDGSTLVSITSYNDKGKITKQCYYKPDGSINSKTIFEYDEFGNATMIEYVEYSSDKIAHYWKNIYKYKYDDKGNMTENCANTYKYDSKGNKTEEYYNGELTSTYKYDGKGNITEECRYEDNNTIYLRRTNQYDGKGNKTEECRYSGPNLDYKETYKYDKKGNVTEIHRFDSNGNQTLIIRHTYKYDKRGYMLEDISYRDNNPSSKNTYKYDDKGNLIESNGTEYEYDYYE